MRNHKLNNYCIPKPEWIRANDATRMFGIGRSTLMALIRDKQIKTKLIKTNFKNTSGIRLISVESIRAMIEEAE